MSKLFIEASKCTFDDSLKNVLLNCSKGKYPIQFIISKGKINTQKGNVYDLPTDPMILCNIVHDILNGYEKSTRPIIGSSTRSSRVTNEANISDDAIYSFARRTMQNKKRDIYYMDKLLSCIITAISLGDITNRDFIMNGNSIQSIYGIDIDKLIIIKRCS